MKKNYAITFGFLMSVQFLTAQTTQTFNYTGSVQTFTVPSCVSSIVIQAKGAQGGIAAIGGTGGLGGIASGTLNVTPGDILSFYIGGSNGYNGGGSGGANGNPVFGFGGYGGGASDVRLNGTTLQNRVIVAGGGGGGGSNGTWPSCQVAGPAGNGGDGGGLIGSTGTFGVGNPCNCQGGGGAGATGGTQVSGGIHGAYAGNTACLRANWTAGQDGTLGQGGNGSAIYYNGTGGSGGGGGGYYGGGSGGSGSDTTPGGGGGGGSSYTGGVTSGSTTSATWSGNGIVTITYTSSAPPTPGVITGSSSVCANATGNYSIVSIPGATTYTWTVPNGSTINSGQGTTSINLTAGNTSGNISVTATFSCGTSGPSTLMLTIGLVPVIVASSNPASVCSGGTSTLTASGGSTYTWMPGNLTGASVVVAPLITTTYTVTGTNAQGCSNTAMTTVTVIPSPVVTANSTAASVCAGASVTLTGSGASTYTWDNNVINAVSFVPTATTTYMVTGTFTNGCTNTATITVTVNPLPIVTANSSAASVCAGAGVTLTGGGASTYTWNNNVIDAISFVPTATTTYMVTGTDANGCVNTATTTITVNPLPVVTATSSAASVCTGGSVILTGGGASTYTWNNNVMNAFPFIPTATNTYMVTGTDVNGCVNTATTTVTVNSLPTVSLGPNIIQCGGTAMLNAGNMGSTYMWSNASTTQTITVSASGTYIVFVTDVNGCIGTNSVVVTINSIPAVTASASSLFVCVDDASVTLSGLPSGGVWRGPGVTASLLSPTAAGVGMHTAVYSYTDANGCEGIASVNVQVNALPVVSLGPNIIQCGGTAMLDAGNTGSIYLWSDLSTSQTLTVSTSGTYIVVVTNVNGCMGSDSAVVTINSNPTVTASASSVVVCVADAIVTLTGTPTGGVWSGPGVNGLLFSPTAAGVGLQSAVYSYTDVNGCEGMDSVSIQVNACVGLAENILANGVSVYPNPNNGNFTLGVNANVGALTIKITDMQGRVVYASVDKNVSAGFVKQISLDTQSSGMYLMHIIANGEQTTEKISINK